MTFIVHTGDCRDVMDDMEANSIDAIVCDPPYGLKFMGKGWDHGVPGLEYWIKALRVAKPGAHLLAFGGTRMFHRLMVAIEDAGWEIRDTIGWIYSQGFPKSLNLDREIGNAFCGCEISDDSVCGLRQRPDNADGLATQGQKSDLFETVQRKTTGDGSIKEGVSSAGAKRAESETTWIEQPCMERRGDAPASARELRSGEIRSGAGMGEADGTQGRVCDGASTGDGGVVWSITDTNRDGSPCQPQAAGQRENELGIVAGQSESQAGGAWPLCGGCGKPRIPRGLGTALKPAWEPVIVARKPLIGTVAANVLAHGTGAINIDGCRVESTDSQLAEKYASVQNAGARTNAIYGSDNRDRAGAAPHDNGRWPANLIHSGDEEVLDLFPNSNGSGGSLPQVKITGYGDGIGNGKSEYFGGERKPHNAGTGSAARFFYCPKASRADRNEGLGDGGEAAVSTSATMRECEDADWSRRNGNHHPTVKPTNLMRYLCRLVTPPKGLILDPFAGSGSTGKAAVLEGFHFVGIELEADYADIARARIDAAEPSQAGLEFAA